MKPSMGEQAGHGSMVSGLNLVGKASASFGIDGIGNAASRQSSDSWPEDGSLMA